jgi:leucyl-tRNA synthetase
MPRKLFVTTALPYANAPFHIGHMMEYIQADIWVRFQRMGGHALHFVCADDAHGAAIMIAAENAGKTPQELSPRSPPAGSRRLHICSTTGTDRRPREPRPGGTSTCSSGRKA